MLDYLNSKHETIRLEMELPNLDGYLPIFDIAVNINEDGTIDRKLFVKAANKVIMLHFHSHHLSSTKKATALNELQRATDSSSAPNQDDALQKTQSSSGEYGNWLLDLEQSHNLQYQHIWSILVYPGHTCISTCTLTHTCTP